MEIRTWSLTGFPSDDTVLIWAKLEALLKPPAPQWCSSPPGLTHQCAREDQTQRFSNGQIKMSVFWAFGLQPLSPLGLQVYCTSWHVYHRHFKVSGCEQVIDRPKGKLIKHFLDQISCLWAFFHLRTFLEVRVKIWRSGWTAERCVNKRGRRRTERQRGTVDQRLERRGSTHGKTKTGASTATATGIVHLRIALTYPRWSTRCFGKVLSQSRIGLIGSSEFSSASVHILKLNIRALMCSQWRCGYTRGKQE